MVSKPASVRRQEDKCRILEMNLKLRDQKLKTILFIYRLLHQNLTVTTNQKPTIDTHTKESNPHMKLRRVIKSQKRTNEEGNKKTYRNKSQAINKMAIRT